MWKFFLIIGASVGLTACGTCLQTESYTKIPYDLERTAGSGVVIYENYCESEVSEQQEPTVDTEKAREIFWKRQKK